jgi:replication-associated recombination protein RarA
VPFILLPLKSNASYLAIGTAQQLVKQTGDLPIPIHLRNAPTKLMKELGYGEEYKYSHDFANNFADQEFLPDVVKTPRSTFPEIIPEKILLENFKKTVER